MDISSRLDFAAEPATVYAMMTDHSFLEQLVEQAGATSHSIDIAGPRTRVEMKLPAPEQLRSFAGSGITAVQQVEWAEAAADGSRTGALEVSTPGLPVTAHGNARLQPGGRGTIVDYTGEVKVNIPLVGRRVEQQAAPFVKQAIDAQQQVGDEWLATHA